MWYWHKDIYSQAWWGTPLISALGRWRQDNRVFETSLGYTARLSQKNKNKNKTGLGCTSVVKCLSKALCLITNTGGEGTNSLESQIWWSTPVIPALGKLKQKVPKIEASLSYMVRLSQKSKNKPKPKDYQNTEKATHRMGENVCQPHLITD
jgi:hypothetical protein